MNQKQAKKLAKMSKEEVTELFKVFSENPTLLENWENLHEFANDGTYMVKTVPFKPAKEYSEIVFNHPPHHYRPVPEREIDWEKAMSCEPTAWGTEFLFWNEGHTVPTRGNLFGYRPYSEHPFSSRKARYQHCKPIPGFNVPESWLKYESQLPQPTMTPLKQEESNYHWWLEIDKDGFRARFIRAGDSIKTDSIHQHFKCNEWIACGNKIPTGLPADCVVEVLFMSGDTETNEAGIFKWSNIRDFKIIKEG